MSLRRSDLRFALPLFPKRAVVLGLDEWSESLRTAGVELGVGPAPLDLAVAPEDRADEAISSGAATVILEGRGGSRDLAGRRLRDQRLPSPTDPRGSGFHSPARSGLSGSLRPSAVEAGADHGQASAQCGGWAPGQARDHAWPETLCGWGSQPWSSSARRVRSPPRSPRGSDLVPDARARATS